MIEFESSGSFRNTERFLARMSRNDIFQALHRYGQIGVRELAAATPVDSNLAAESWSYEVVKERGSWTIHWLNTNIESGIPVVILLQYGHAVNGGGYVRGQDFINPAIRPVFDKIASEVWKVVTSA